MMAVGETGVNDNGHGYNVQGIGRDEATKIAYRALTVYLTSSSNYAACRNDMIQAASDLYGAGSQAVITTTNAFYAGGVGDKWSVSE